MAGPPKLPREPQPITLARERLRMCVYGDAGVGKTTLALTFPRTLVIDTDGGLISGAIQGMEGTSYEPRSWKEFDSLYFWAKAREAQFDTIVIDSITSLQRMLIDEMVDSTVDVKKPDKPIMEFVPEQGTYLANQRQIARILNEFRGLGKHMVVTAGVRERMGKRSPDMAPGLFTIVNHWSSVLAELVVVTRGKDGTALDIPARALLTAPSSDRESKSRFRKLMPFVASPDFTELWSRIQSEYEEALTRLKTQAKGA
jgi:hypothetical protein